MVINKYVKLLFNTIMFSCVFLLAACPGQGDRFRPEETTQVELINDNVCFPITNAMDYQPAIISINPKGTPPKQQSFIDNPSLSIESKQLCISPSFYHFADNGKYIVEFVLSSEKKFDEPRKFVIGVGINHRQVYNFPLTDREISRPYGSIEVSE